MHKNKAQFLIQNQIQNQILSQVLDWNRLMCAEIVAWLGSEAADHAPGRWWHKVWNVIPNIFQITHSAEEDCAAISYPFWFSFWQADLEPFGFAWLIAAWVMLQHDSGPLRFCLNRPCWTSEVIQSEMVRNSWRWAFTAHCWVRGLKSALRSVTKWKKQPWIVVCAKSEKPRSETLSGRSGRHTAGVELRIRTLKSAESQFKRRAWCPPSQPLQTLAPA